jgi:hypothetical protein
VQNGEPVAFPDLRPDLVFRRLGIGDLSLTALLALLLATSVMGWPLRDAGAEGVLAVLKILTLAVGVVAVAPQRVLAAGAAAAALVVVVGQLVAGEQAPPVLLARLVCLALIGAALLGQVFRPGRVTVHRVLGAVAVYVLLATAWGTAYQALAILRPGSLRGAAGAATTDEAMWLSFITITTTGYGDVLPVSSLARSLAALEALVGVLFPAILISRLVSLVRGFGSEPGAQC